MALVEDFAFHGNFLSMSVRIIPHFHDAWVSVGRFAPNFIR